MTLEDYLLSFDPPEPEYTGEFPSAAIKRGYVLTSDWWDRESVYSRDTSTLKYPLQPNPIRPIKRRHE